MVTRLVKWAAIAVATVLWFEFAPLILVAIVLHWIYKPRKP
jgi:hypothetical protein